MYNNNNKTDLRQYADDNLGVLFINDEGLYNLILNEPNDIDKFIENHVEPFYLYTSEQLEDFKDTYQTEMEENDKIEDSDEF